MKHRKLKRCNSEKNHCICGGEVKFFEKYGKFICEVELKDEMYKMGYTIQEAFI